MVLVASISLGPLLLSAQSGPEVARAFREANEVSIVRDFAELLSYPNEMSSGPWAWTRNFSRSKVPHPSCTAS